MQFSFIFPIYNESAILSDRINLFIEQLRSRYRNHCEILLIENGSDDGSWRIAKDLVKKYTFIKSYKLAKASYGSAIRLGLLKATGRKIFIFNVDYFDVQFIDNAAALLDEVEVVIGSKTLFSSQDQRPFLRQIATYFFNVCLRLILNYPGTDTHGIKAFRRTPLLLSSTKACYTKNELFDTELILRLTRSGAIFIDLPQAVVELRPSRYLPFKRFRSSVEDLCSIIKYKYLLKRNFFSTLIDADDFGLSKKVNEAILEEANCGLLDIVSIMPNLVSQKDARKLIGCEYQLAYAMHFNLLRGKPLSNAFEVSSLINKKGKFYNIFVFSWRLLFGLIRLDEVEKEFFAQYRRLLALNLKPRYLNSEQHLHIFSPINAMLERNIGKTSIEKIRSIVSSKSSLKTKYLRLWVLLALAKFFNMRYKQFTEFKNAYQAEIIHPGA